MKADRVIFVCILILAAIYFYAIEKIPTLQVGDPIGAKAIPRFLGGALLVTAGLLWFEMRVASGNAGQVEKPERSGSNTQYWIVAAVVGWTALYFAAFGILGYALATTIYLNVLMAYFNKGKWKTNVLVATLFSFGSYLAFTKLFHAPLPAGLLPF